MRLPSGKRFGQSDYELALAVFLSFFLHAGIVAVSLLFSFSFAPKFNLPPFYDVKLVGHLAEAPSVAPPAAAPASPVTRPAKAAPGTVKTAPKPVKTAPKKGDMPEFSQKKAAPQKQAEPEQTAAPQTPAASGAKSAGRAGPVAVSGTVSTASGELTIDPSYVARITNIIQGNWSPPPGMIGLKTKVVFRVTRIGKVFGDVKIEESSGNNFFDMAAKRAIFQSAFPRMPEEFYQEYAVFSVDLQETQ